MWHDEVHPCFLPVFSCVDGDCFCWLEGDEAMDSMSTEFYLRRIAEALEQILKELRNP